ncbi:hypothetical protein DQ244_11330 [Blastococcus sp. TBT05-19]|uniref:hypothetical protein n=1 Tax=Blastococcus sp. TBT05-19 TaxID=2250581 RepID=UPI000DE96CDF|nr:hypothetical protein [Blastococcus sp. TBT05-19]RBY90065.1 hypothetical protein DQ244_11330 [Blastococcus sp. TBT05-19]
MTEPSAQRPVPGPPRPAPPSTPAPDARPDPAPGGAQQDRLAGLEELPVAEHVAVFEAEHERLQRELGTIDPL